MKPRESLPRRESSLVIILANVPTLFFLLLLIIVPVVYSFYISLKVYKTGSPPVFSWFENYAQIFQGEEFWKSLKVSLIFAFFATLMPTLLGMFLAVLLNEKVKGGKFFKGSYILPWAVPPIVVGIIWGWIFNGGFGLINYLLSSLGLIKEYLPFLSSPRYALLAVIVAACWRWTPLACLLCSAGLQSIPPGIYDAARVDGTSEVQNFFLITLPLLRNSLLLVATTLTMWNIREFDLIYSMTRGGPSAATKVLGYSVYSTAFKYGNLGQGAALGFILAFVTLMIAALYIIVLYKRIEY